jgi:hypothetical protein
MYYGQCPFVQNNEIKDNYQYQAGFGMRNAEPVQIAPTPAPVPAPGPAPVPNPMYPDMNVQLQQLEGMYPKIYHVIYPEVVRVCDHMDGVKGNMYLPKKDEVERMIDEIYVKVEVNVSNILKQESREDESRQFGIGPRGLLRGLIGTLLIRDLLGRRRRPVYGYPYGYSYGYPFATPFIW